MATHHTRSSSKRSVPVHARPSKSASLSKRRNSHGASKKSAHHQDLDSEDDPVMATSFLQYCTVCEKQIVTPSNFVLYCSESCRKQDNNKQLPQVGGNSPILDPFSSCFFEEPQFPDIVAPRSPTAPSKRSSCTFSDDSFDDNAASGDEESDTPKHYRLSHTAPDNTGTTVRPPHRPQYTRTSTSYTATPSLSHTPASSISYSMPYTPATRPLPPRSNPHNSSYSSYAGGYTDLVTPITYSTAPSSPHHQYSFKSAAVSTTTSKGNVEGEIMYEKSPIPSIMSANGSLKSLFAAPHLCKS